MATKFTFKNYLKELHEARLILVLCFIVGLIAGCIYSFNQKTSYMATAKFSTYNAEIENGAVNSPYAQIGELISSKDLILSHNSELKSDNFPAIVVAEKPHGVFTIEVTSSDSEQAINVANAVAGTAESIIKDTFVDAENYKVTILEKAEDSDPSITTKKRIISAAIIAVAFLVVALIIIFIKFDYQSEK